MNLGLVTMGGAVTVANIYLVRDPSAKLSLTLCNKIIDTVLLVNTMPIYGHDNINCE